MSSNELEPEPKDDSVASDRVGRTAERVTARGSVRGMHCRSVFRGAIAAAAAAAEAAPVAAVVAAAAAAAEPGSAAAGTAAAAGPVARHAGAATAAGDAGNAVDLRGARAGRLRGRPGRATRPHDARGSAQRPKRSWRCRATSAHCVCQHMCVCVSGSGIEFRGGPL